MCQYGKWIIPQIEAVQQLLVLDLFAQYQLNIKPVS